MLSEKRKQDTLQHSEHMPGIPGGGGGGGGGYSHKFRIGVCREGS